MDLSADSFNLVEYIHPEDVPALDEFLHQPIIAELTFEKTCRIRNHQGQYHWFLV